MAVFAVVNPSGGVVSNIIVGGDLETVSNLVGGAVEITEETGSGGIGHTWDAETKKFTQPTT